MDKIRRKNMEENGDVVIPKVNFVYLARLFVYLR